MSKAFMPYQALPTLEDFQISSAYLHLHTRIGHGTFGVVYTATDTRRQALRAVKMVHQSKYLRREIELHRRVSPHPGVVTLFSISQSDEMGIALFALEYCPGGTLDSVIADGRYEKQPALLRTHLGQLLDAVDFCHSRGVYHRDIKPQNILMSADHSQVYLSDFGTATEAKVSTERPVGTRCYMPPEALETSPRGMPVPHIPMLADSWALGIVLVNMVTRRMLWREANPASRSFCAYTHHGQAFLHCILSARVTPAAIGWLAGMLAPSPADRWTVARSKRQLAAVAEIIRPQSPLRVDCAMKISPSSQPSPPRLQELSACTSVDHELVDPFARWLEC